jgi:hypothetical protein
VISFLRSIAKVPSLATFVLNEIAPYNKDFEVVSATTSKHSACLPLADQTAGIKLAVSVPVGGNRRPDDETQGLKSSSDENLASRGISARCI